MAVIVWPRRHGKDMTTSSAYPAERMVEEPMVVVLVFPTKKQGYNAFWSNIENDGFRTINRIPKELIAAQSNTEDNMRITLKNGSVFVLLGADNPEALRGANGKIYIFSEFVDIPSEALNVVRPITAQNGGQIILQSTPKLDGISGGTFKRLYEAAAKDPTQYADYLPADKAGVLTDEQLEVIRQDYIDQNGNDFKFRQEMLLDWGQASQTSYYGALLSEMEKDGRIGTHPYNPDYPVYTSWDLGMADSTAVLFWQYYDKEFHIIDAYETHNIGDEPIIRFVQSKPYNYAWHFFPHDGAKRDSDAISRIQKIRGLGLTNASLLTRRSKEDGIKRTHELLSKKSTTIHKPLVYEAVEKLKKYSRKFNQLTGDYEGPDHKTESHTADSVRYAAEAIEQAFDETTGEFYYSGIGEEKTTRSEPLVSTATHSGDSDYDDWDISDDWDV